MLDGKNRPNCTRQSYYKESRVCIQLKFRCEGRYKRDCARQLSGVSMGNRVCRI